MSDALPEVLESRESSERTTYSQNPLANASVITPLIRAGISFNSVAHTLDGGNGLRWILFDGDPFGAICFEVFGELEGKASALLHLALDGALVTP